MSYICEQRNVCVDTADTPVQNPAIGKSSDAIVKSNLPDADPENVKDENTTEAMDTEHNVQGCKRLLSDSDTDFKTVVRRQRIHPVPNLSSGKQRDKNSSTSAAKKAYTDNVP